MRSIFAKSGLFILFIILFVLMALVWIVSTESGLQWLSNKTMNFAPENIVIEKVEGRLIGPMTLIGLNISQAGQHILSERIIIDWSPMSLLSAKVDIQQLHISGLDITLPASEKTDDKLVLPDIHLPVRLAINNAKIDGLIVNQPDSKIELKHIKLDAHTKINKLTIDALEVLADNFSVNIYGNISPNSRYQHQFDIDWQVKLPTSEKISGKGQIKGDLNKTQLHQELSGALQLSLEASATNLIDALSWKADVDLKLFDTSKIDASWPLLQGSLKLKAQGDLVTANVTGKAKANSTETGAIDASFQLQRLVGNTIKLDELNLDAPDISAVIRASGRINPDVVNGGDVALLLDWKDLRWPLKGKAQFEQATGTGSIEGTVDNYRISLTTVLLLAEQSTVNLIANADGNLESLNVHNLRLLALEGETSGTAQLSWKPVLQWQATLDASKVNPGIIMPDWPGSLNAKFNTQGRVENEKLIMDAEIEQLNGTLRKYPVSLSSRVNLIHDVLTIDEFKFQSGKSIVNLAGQIGETQKLHWDISTPDLAELYPGASGQFDLNGQLTGSQNKPVITAKVNAKALSVLDYEMASLTGDITLDINSWKKIDINIVADSLKVNQQAIQKVELVADSELIKFNVSDNEINANLILQGEVHDDGWRGLVTQANMITKQFGEWKNNKSSLLEISSDAVLLEALCWHNNAGKLCVGVDGENGNWKSQLEMNQVPLAIFSPWLPPDLKFEGLSHANASLRYAPQENLRLEASIELPAAAVSYPLLEGERDRWEYREGKIDIVVNDQGLSAKSLLNLSNGDHFNAQLSLPNVNLLKIDSQRQLLQANAKLSIHDLGLIEALLPDIQDLKGDIEFTLTANGTLDKPEVMVNGNLNNGALRIPALGLKIERLTLTSKNEGLNKFIYQLSAHSGEGDLTVNGETLLESRSSWPTTINIKGDNVEVSRIPEARVIASPDIQIKLQPGLINITGNVAIPQAKLQPKDISLASKVSDDAVIVSEEDGKDAAWLLTSKIRITLGDRVNFYGYGFEGRFGGSLLLEDSPGQPTRATGEITVPEGLYAAYGQRLKVEHGRVLFTGGPVSNPGLDLRAVRHVNDVTVGLKVRGSLSQPQIELFSIPSLGETDTLAYLLLGRPMENTSGEEGNMMAKAALALSLSGGDRLARTLGDRFGFDEMRVESSESGDQASLVIGRYLSPKLYLSYGVGLMEGFNTLNLRYQLSDRLQLKAESGEHQGADIVYTIER